MYDSVIPNPHLKLTPTGDWDLAYDLVRKYGFNDLDHATFLEACSRIQTAWFIQRRFAVLAFASISLLPHDVFAFDLYVEPDVPRFYRLRAAYFAAREVVRIFQERWPGRPLWIFPDARNAECIRAAGRVGFRHAREVEILGSIHICLSLPPLEERSLEPPPQPLARPQQ